MELKNCQAHLNNSLAIADELFEFVDHFLGLTLKGLIKQHRNIHPLTLLKNYMSNNLF